MKNTVIAVIIVVLLVMGVVYVFVNKDTIFEKKPENNGNNQTVGPQTYNVEIKDNTFVPPTLNIKVGDTVIWTNKDSVRHIVLSDRLTEISSKALFNEESYSHTFNKAGEFPYHCEVHYFMKGKVVVS